MWPLETAGSFAVQLTYRLTDRLVQWTIVADVPSYAVPWPGKEVSDQKRKGQFNDLHICSYSQQIRNETLLWGSNITRGWRPFQAIVFQLLAGPVFSVLVRTFSLAGPCTTGRLDTESPNVRKTDTGGKRLEETMRVTQGETFRTCPID